jgi:hypothetical protein
MRAECTSEIVGVVVYARGAVVTRRVHVSGAAEGDLEVVVPGITALAEPGTVRARVQGAGRTLVSVHSAPFVPLALRPASAGQAELRELEVQLDAARSERALLGRRRTRLLAATPDPGLAVRAGRADVEARLADALVVHDVLGHALAAVDARRAELDVQLQRLEDEHRAALSRQSWASTADRTPTGAGSHVITVHLTGSGPVEQLEVEYVVLAARWWPRYTLELGAQATLWVEAVVAQGSGEDWADVPLGLCTSDLGVDARLPTLRSIRYGKAQAPKLSGMRPTPPGLDRLFVSFDAVFIAHLSVRNESHGMVGGAPPPPPPPPPAYESSELLSEPVLPMELERSYDTTRAGRISSEPEELPARLMSGPSMAPMASAPSMPMPKGGFARHAPAEKARKREAPGAPQASFGASRGGGGASDKLGMSAAYDEGGMSREEAEEEPLLDDTTSEDEWLDFDGLRMGAPDDRRARGRLHHPRADDPAARARARARMDLEGLDPGTEAQDVLTSRGRYDHRWDTRGVVRIPSDGRAHRVRVESFTARPSTRLWTVPRELAEVFREASLHNPTPGPLLAGEVDVYVDGSLLTTAPLPHVDRGGIVRVGMGVEERLRVARNTEVAEDTAGLLGGSTAVDHRVSIELSSALGLPATVEVYDRIPVTDDKGLEIKLLSAQPPHEPYEQVERGAPLRGGVSWKVQLEPGGKRELRLHYRLTFNKGSEVNGGNRRD